MAARKKSLQLFSFRINFFTTFSLTVILCDNRKMDFGYALQILGQSPLGKGQKFRFRNFCGNLSKSNFQNNRTKSNPVNYLNLSGKISEIWSKSEIFNFRYIDFKTLLDAKNCQQSDLRSQESVLNAHITLNYAS